MKAKFACNYAVLRFLPYPETQEFVNIGIVVMCPQHGFFDYKIETRRRDRVTDFFPELAPEIFIQGRRNFCGELHRLKKMVNANRAPGQMDLNIGSDYTILFNEVIKPREAIFRFGHAGTVLADDPEIEVQRLFEYYVERQFAQHEDYHEKIMAKRLANTFRVEHILNYCPERLGDDDYHVLIPFVRRHGDAAVDIRAIKPIDLAKDETTRIIEHGDRWLARVRHLQQQNFRPADFLFPVKLPAKDKKTRIAEQICGELQNLGTKIVLFGETEKIIEFARGA